ncbi:MAG: hypothetical protein EZS28_049743 [Streblomastix strix]|uniref:Uncharacterized protein n=1 Tax=Streblomastix strix TaxID=222440 RepID=A0A5J4TB15_9EUKA|nr:MAG: hypothetical protein EZS28_049743 [Streblomastix strix]
MQQQQQFPQQSFSRIEVVLDDDTLSTLQLDVTVDSVVTSILTEKKLKLKKDDILIEKRMIVKKQQKMSLIDYFTNKNVNNQQRSAMEKDSDQQRENKVEEDAVDVQEMQSILFI